MRFLIQLFILILLTSATVLAERVTISLDGVWQIEDSVSPEEMPKSFGHTIPVPGLAFLAQPAFPDVGAFYGREYIENLINFKKQPATLRTNEKGRSLQKRNYFWYSRTFTPPVRREVALLKINKAQFTTAIWLNGKKIGEHNGCFTAGYFNLSEAIRWDGENRLVVRIGAHPNIVPPSIPAGTDFEKEKWIPGIYDSVSLILADNPVIESVQVAPRLSTSDALIQTVLRNYGTKPVQITIQQEIRSWKDNKSVVRHNLSASPLGPGETKTITEPVKIPAALLWTPENPFLYLLQTRAGADSLSTRFGMRDFRFESVTKRAYLNGKIHFLRGSNITLHRFFEDPKCGALPWNREWVHKLLAEIPRQMHWDTFRFCIGPVPEFWFDIADEAGLLIQNEYPIWSWHQEYGKEELIREYTEWMRDHWNHPSVVLWDSNNETFAPILGDEIIPIVRKLDLSDRLWENGYNLPSGPNDPVEDHPYLFSNAKFRMTQLEEMTGAKSNNSARPTGHAPFINEYSWLWVTRDGSPTLLTRELYQGLLGDKATPQEHLELASYLDAGLTEYWRAHRNFAGVLHFVYLTSSHPDVFTADHFQDIEKLELNPYFSDYMGEAFKPLGVYINFWQPSLKPGQLREYSVMLTNDEDRPLEGNLSLEFTNPSGEKVEGKNLPFSLAPLGTHTLLFALPAPTQSGEYLLKATARQSSATAPSPTLSRRKVRIEN